MKIIDLIAAFHNWLSDKDFMWWPFSFLRPAPHEKITFRSGLIMTSSFGGLTFLFFTVFAIMNNAFTIKSAIMTLLACFIGFFLWFNFITRPLWNRRVTQLQGK